MNTVWQILVKTKLGNGVEKKDEGVGNFYDFRTVHGHTLQMCKEFHAMVQRMMKEGIIKFYDEKQTLTN